MVDFARYFEGFEAKLTAELSAIRSATTHAGNKGAKAEHAFRQFLTDHLPRSVEVGHGEVIDQHGLDVGESTGGEHQVDVLLVSDDHPRFGNIEEPSTYFIEGILAAGEVKSSLQMGQLEAAFMQAVAFKKLKTNPGKSAEVYARDGDLDRFVVHRPYFLFAYESAVKLDALIARLKLLEQQHGTDPVGHFDAIIVLDQGCMFNLTGENSAFVLKDAQRGFLKGWNRLEAQPLMALVTWLSAVMPSVRDSESIAFRYLAGIKPKGGRRH